MPFAGYKDFDECVAQNQDKSDPDAYCGSIKHKVEGMVKAESKDVAEWVAKHFTPGSPHQHGQGAHTSTEQPRLREESKPPKPAHQKPFPRKKDVFGKLAKQHPDEYPEDWGSDAPYQSLEEIEAQVEKLLKAGGCPPDQHKHGGHNYCHPVGRKHRSHGGQAVHGLKYPGQKTERPRAARMPMKKVGEIRQLIDAGWAEPKELGNKLMHLTERLRGKVSQDVLALLRHASGRLQQGDKEDGMLYIDQAFRRYRDEITGGHEYEGPPPKTKQGVEDEMRRILGGGRREQRMRKAEKKRQDSEPEVTYDEPVEMIYEVDNRLKAVSKALKRLIKRQAKPSVASDLQRLEKRVRDLSGCC